ncbi:helix-turn-helix domain-containing protein [Flavobacterium sp. HXWNR69]|uniref:Helix-turn-helix domain-containing protein n=1 Tax=Flavobacterium fragile TaxID=2949085 RepID=A0ABT0TJ37_9FLAO|nr:helix-turn-helix transcriptional regulator [Flavobacterium sp. HXWNR69]MCL9770978.1 helix-turn-helix domain-containing protein [Flavobacterium sp. HXWNR69]
MVNIDDFIKRLENILEYYNLSASAFADRINIQRSSMSHLLSGRNKPSLDFIIKVVTVFPEVDLYWLLNGKGVFPKSDVANPSEQKSENFNIIKSSEHAPTLEPDLFSTVDNINKTIPVEEKDGSYGLDQNLIADEEIDRIVIFFKNGSFKSYRP